MKEEDNMKKAVSKILVALIVISMFRPFSSISAATMRYYDNVKPEEFPERLQQYLSNHPWEDGFLDVTKQPYNAKGDGVTDDSDAIQKAIDDAYASNLIVYFPEGKYLVSKQLVLNQYPANWFDKDKNIKFNSQRKFGNLLIGSTKGTTRPKIVLKDNSNVSDNILLLYRYIDPNAKEIDVNDRAKHYIATLRGIDIDMGYNPKVSAVSMDGAQYCTIQDINITGKSFYAGIHKIPGAVGSIINVKVTGGNIGILSDSYVPEALVVGAILENQKEYGVKILDSRNSPVNLVGFKITSPDSPSPNYRAVYVDERGATSEVGGKQSRAHVTLIDGTIEVKGDNGKAIESYNQYVVLKNVYVKANTIIAPGIKNSIVKELKGDKSNWLKIGNYAFVAKDNNGFIHVNGEEHGNSNSDAQYYDSITKENPSIDFIRKHIWPVKMPSYDDSEKVNIVTDYGATPYNNNDDDAIAIQRAIDDTTKEGSPNYRKAVFIPRGHFQIKSTIILKKGTTIFGAGKNISVIHQSSDFKVSKNTFLVDTVNDRDANIVMSDFAILRQESSKSKGLENNKYMSMLRIQSNNTVFRDVQFAGIEKSSDNYFLSPEVVFSNNAGGSIYNLAVNTNVSAEADGNIHGDYRRVLIQGVTNPLKIYQCGVNNAEKAYMMEIATSSNVSIYAIKFEEQNQLLKIKDSSNISVIGGYGYFTIVDNIDSIITIENSKQIYLAGIGRSSMRKYDERENRAWIINGKDSISDDYDIILYMSSSAYPVQPKKELLANNNFENGLANWETNGTAKVSVENSKVHQGATSIKVSNQKSATAGIVQDITNVLKKEGPGNYNMSAWIMKDYEKGQNKVSKKNDKKKSQKTDLNKAYAEIELKHDGITEYFTIEDTTHNYWNRISGNIDINWDKLESAKIYIINPDLKTDYYIDEMSLTKNFNTTETTTKKPNKFFHSLGLTSLIFGLFSLYLKKSFK